MVFSPLEFLYSKLFKNGGKIKFEKLNYRKILIHSMSAARGVCLHIFPAILPPQTKKAKSQLTHIRILAMSHEWLVDTNRQHTRPGREGQ